MWRPKPADQSRRPCHNSILCKARWQNILITSIATYGQARNSVNHCECKGSQDVDPSIDIIEEIGSSAARTCVCHLTHHELARVACAGVNERCPVAAALVRRPSVSILDHKVESYCADERSTLRWPGKSCARRYRVRAIRSDPHLPDPVLALF
jgi:hypothetical protein